MLYTTWKLRLLPCALLAIAALWLAPGAGAAAGVWSTNGPYGGDVKGIVVDPAQPSTLYAAGQLAVFKSVDAGATWTPLSAFDNVGVQQIAINPEHPQTVWVATGRGLFSSTDGGQTWTQASVVVNIHGDPTDLSNRGFLTVAISGGAVPRIYTVTAWDGIEYSDDGVHWTLASHPQLPAGETMLFANPYADGPVFLSSVDGEERSIHGGATWLPATGVSGFGQDVSFDPQDPDHVYVAGATQSQYFESHDGGATFTTVTTSLNGSIDTLTVAPGDPAHLTASGSRWFAPSGLDGGVMAPYVATSDDGGATWTTQAAPLDMRTLVPDPTDPIRMYVAGSGNAVWLSVDSGATWSRADQGLTATSPSRIAADPTNGQVAYAVDSGVLYRTEDGGGSWQVIPGDALQPGYAEHRKLVRSVTVTADGTVYAVLALGMNASTVTSVIHSTDEGATWTSAASGLPSEDLSDIYSTGDHTLFVTLYEGLGPEPHYLYKTTDGGDSWTPVGPNLGWVRSLAIDQATGEMLIAEIDINGGNNVWALYRSHDWGDTWTQLPVQLQGGVGSLAFGGDGTLYADFATGVFESHDDGATWTPQPCCDGVDTLVPDPDDPTVMWAGTVNHGIWANTGDDGRWVQWSQTIAGLAVPAIRFTGESSASTAVDPMLAGIGGSRHAGVWRIIPAPHAMVKPRITGTARPRKLLTCRTGVFSRSTRRTFQWLVNSRLVKHRSAQTFRLSRNAAGHHVSCRVTATGAGGSTRFTTSPLRVNSR